MKADEKIIAMLDSGRHCSVEKYGEKLKLTFKYEILHSLCVCVGMRVYLESTCTLRSLLFVEYHFNFFKFHESIVRH